MFEPGYDYRTICTHRSTISALYNNVEGRPVGEHTETISLITGVFKKRAPQAKCNFIWDIELVLHLPEEKKLSNNSNSDLSGKVLTIKVAVTGLLLDLTSASRVRDLHLLDTRFIVKASQKYVLQFHKPHKSRKQSQKPTTLEFVAFSQEEDLCILPTLMNI